MHTHPHTLAGGRPPGETTHAHYPEPPQEPGHAHQPDGLAPWFPDEDMPTRGEEGSHHTRATVHIATIPHAHTDYEWDKDDPDPLCECPQAFVLADEEIGEWYSRRDGSGVRLINISRSFDRRILAEVRSASPKQRYPLALRLTDDGWRKLIEAVTVLLEEGE